jgi:hypothetical protein
MTRAWVTFFSKGAGQRHRGHRDRRRPGSSGSVAARATVATTMILVGLAAVVIEGAKRRPLRTY